MSYVTGGADELFLISVGSNESKNSEGCLRILNCQTIFSGSAYRLKNRKQRLKFLVKLTYVNFDNAFV